MQSSAAFSQKIPDIPGGQRQVNLLIPSTHIPVLQGLELKKQQFFIIVGDRGATSSSFRGGGNFHKFHAMTSSCLFNRGTTFSQTVTYNCNVFLPADTKSIVQRHTFCTTLVNKKDKTERFATALEAESPVSSEISDFTPCVHAQNNIKHIKYAEKTDD